MTSSDRAEVDAWNGFVDSLRTAGDRLAAETADLTDMERADGFRALLRALNNQLGRFEIDRDRAELVAFNGWRQKFLMDNPDFRYWVADVRPGRRYRIAGNLSGATYMSITAYAVDPSGARATARIDSDAMVFGASGEFTVTLGSSGKNALELPDDVNMVWVRQFHDDVDTDRLGHCSIETLDPVATPAPINPARFSTDLKRLGAMTAAMPMIFATASADDRAAPNELRHWSEMAGGAVFTEPNIHYVRGGWQLEPDEAIIIEGDVVDCRYWNILAHSRFLNSLDYRHRRVSYTGRTAEIVDGRYRFVLAASDPGPGAGDWIDTEGRPFGIVVMRFLQPVRPPELPTVQRVSIHDLPGSR